MKFFKGIALIIARSSFSYFYFVYLIYIHGNQGRNSLNEYSYTYWPEKKTKLFVKKYVNATQLKYFIRKLHHIIELFLFTNDCNLTCTVLQQLYKN